MIIMDFSYWLFISCWTNHLFCTKHPVESYSEEDVANIEKIFEQLIPPHNLEDLVIVDFFGRRFPTWLGTTHLVSVKYLKLIDCNSCVHLPPLGQLPNLKYLKIDGAAAVTKIGPEFVGCRGDNPRSTVAVAFPKLESLSIGDMPNWEEWSIVEEGDAAAAAMEGEVDGCAEIRKGEAPSARLLVLPRLKKLQLVGCPKLRALPRQLGQEATCLEELVLKGASSLKLIDCNSCEHLPPLWQLPNLKYLRIVGAAAVTKIGPEFVGCGRGNPRSTVAVAFPKLESLVIGDMPNWEEWSFVEEGDAAAASMEGEEDGSAEIQKGEAPSPRLQVLPRLKRLGLEDCPKLRALPRQLGQEATCLERLLLNGASSLKVVEDLPFLSENLWIVDCKGLERVSNLNQVKDLSLSHCPELTCVEGFGSLQQLWLDKSMQDISSMWVPGLQEEHQKFHGDDLDIYTWRLR